jgi:hypothetical protein
LETLTANLAGKPRQEEWNGRQYLVVPLTMLVPGVLQGSKGPLLYPAEEVKKSPDDWNHIPIVVYHPMKDGKPVSARSPSILSKYGVGFVFHSRTDSKGVLKGEGWLDVEATRRVDKSVLDSVQLGKPIELSTGLFVDDEPAPEGAIFNDHRGQRKYVGIARNYKPDHLAILPSGKGACSLADGCGVLINEAAMEAYQVIINELEAESVSLYFPDIDSEQLLTANKFNPNQPRDKAGRFATVGQATKAVEKAQGRVAKAQAALEKAKATLKVEKSGLLTAKKGLTEAKQREKAKSPAAARAIGKAKASTGTAPKGKGTRTTTTRKTILPKHEDVAATALDTVRSLERTTRVSPTLDKVHAAITAAHPNVTKEQIKDVLVGLHKDRQIVLERDSGPQHQIPPAVKAVAITGKDLGRDSTHRGHTEYYTTARIPTGGSRPTTSTPAPSRPAASPRAGKSGKSVDEHHAETEALTRSPMSHQDASKAVDSHIANLNKSLNKAQAHELGQKLGLTHPKSATKKAVLDGIKNHIHARRGAHH